MASYKKALAKKHNQLYVENQAYKEDRIRDPEKYKRPSRDRSKVAVIAAGLTAATMEKYRGFM